MFSEMTDSIPWPGFHNGRLLLPLPDAWFIPEPTCLQWKGMRLPVKKEFHVTLLNQALVTRVREAVGVEEIKRLFEQETWAITRTGEGSLLRKDKITSKGHTRCATVIEHIALPALAHFREALGRAADLEVPSVPAHVTLFAGGDARGIGVPDHEALRTYQVATLRLPGIGNRSAPALEERQQLAYCTAEYALDALQTSVHIGARCPIIDTELRRRGVNRAAVVTAYNPFNAKADNVGNELRQQWLGAVLRNERLDVGDAEGRDPDGH